MDKIYIADLDAKEGAIMAKLDTVSKKLNDVSMTGVRALSKINNVIEKQSSRTFTQFSKRDLGMFTSQMFATIGATGRLGSQLSGLATGLATGGAIGAAFAGASALINTLTERTNEWSQALATAAGKLIEIQDPLSGIKFSIPREDLDALISKLKTTVDALKSVQTSGLSAFVGPGPAQILAELGIGTNDQLLANQKILGVLEEKLIVLQAEKIISDELEQLNVKKVKTGEKEIKIQKENELSLQKQLEQISSFAGRRIPGLDQSGLQPIDLSDKNFQMKQVDEWEMMILDWKRNQSTITDSVDQSAEQMNAMVGLSAQIASNFNLAGHTFVGQLSQAVSILTGVSNIILTIATIFGHQASSFGFGGLLSLIGLEKGGRVKLTGGGISISNIPSFAAGGSFSTPSFSGPMYGGGYPVMVHKNETLDVYNSGQTSRMESKMDRLINAVLTTNVHVSKKSTSGRPITVNLDGKKLFTINTAQSNRANRSGKNTGDII